jgi:hypothetical protein
MSFLFTGKLMRHIIIFCFLIFIFHFCPGQELLFQKNRIRHAIYKKGDVITFRIQGERFKITDEIRGFTDSLILFKDYMINPKEITRLYFDQKTRGWFIFRTKYPRLLIIAGAGYGLLDLLNSGEPDHTTLLISGSLITAGILTKLLIPNYFRIRGKKKLIIIDVAPKM